MIDSYNASGSGDLDLITAAGVVTARNATTGLVTIANSTTYYCPLSGPVANATLSLGGNDKTLTPAHTALLAVHLAWSAPVVAAITLEESNFPAFLTGQQAHAANIAAGTSAPIDVSDVDTTAGNWLQDFLSSANIPIAGGSVASNTITTSALGGAMLHIGNVGCKRLRLKIVVTTGGTLRVNRRGKSGG